MQYTMFMWVAAAVLHAATVRSSAAAAGHQLTEPRSYALTNGGPSNYIITSKPFTVRDDANAGTIKWRRDTVTGASLIGASDPAKAKYSIECTDNNECAGIELGAGGSDATFKPYTQDELNRILKRYGEADGEAESSDKILSYDDGAAAGNQDKSKASWNLVDSQQQHQQQQQGPKSPYDDRRGWVTLEPMAWSSSHIQKWEPNNRPTWPPPPQDHGPSGGGGGGYAPWTGNRPAVVQRPSQSYGQPLQHHHHQQPQQSDWTTERPWIRPTYDYSSKPGSGGPAHYQKPQNSQSFYGGGGGWNNAEQDIITDGKPGQFPADAYHKPWNGGGTDYGQQQPSYGPRPTEVEGDGQWVLLSSTKGYSIPHRPNRSLQGRSVSVDAVSRPLETVSRAGFEGSAAAGSVDTAAGRRGQSSSKRTVRLMVLPPEKDSPNVTTSHNGMIQIDGSGKTVDEEQREYAAARALRENEENDVRVFSDRTGKANDDRRAVIAAVGAGMLPAATMAMFLPMMVSRKRRDLRPEVVLQHHYLPQYQHHHHMYPR